MFWLEAVGIPYIALLVLAIFEGKGRAGSYAQMFTEIGIDACILGIGICGAIFANPDVEKKLGSSAFPVGITMLLITMGLTGFCRHQRDWDKLKEIPQARLSIFLGLVILGINTAIVWRAR